MRDITAKKKNQFKIEELSAKTIKQNEVLKELAFINSHKLRGPLVTISAGIELLRNETDIETIIEKFKLAGNELDQVIKKSVTLLSDMVVDIEKQEFLAKLEVNLVFCIDDDHLQLLINKRILNGIRPSLKIINFYDARFALDSLKVENPDLIFLDLNMPGMSGWEFLVEMKLLNLDTDVYILSSLVDPFDKQKAKQF